jgi:ribosome-associated translation inhibitor RaiA
MIEFEVTTKGDVPDDAARLARERLASLDSYVNEPVLGARVVLRQEADPRIERPATAEGELNIDGHLVRAHVAYFEMPGAIDSLAHHMQRRIRQVVDRLSDRHRRPAGAEEEGARRGDRSPHRTTYLSRPPTEREIVRRKNFPIAPMSVTEAAFQMAALDHLFYLFVDVGTGADSIVYRRDDGRLGVIAPAGNGEPGGEHAGIVYEESRMSGPTALEDAVREMDELDHRFLYFVDADTERGNVIYLRYDGHYGLIQPA